MLETLQVNESDERDKVWQSSAVKGVGDEMRKRWLNCWWIARGRKIGALKCSSNEPT